MTKDFTAFADFGLYVQHSIINSVKRHSSCKAYINVFQNAPICVLR